MSVLWRYFFAICCFKKEPQDVPASQEILSLSLLGYGSGSFVLALANQPVDIAVASALIDSALLASLCYMVLLLWGLTARWLQTTTALFGTGTLFSLIAIPLSYWLARVSNEDPLFSILILFLVFLLIWNVAVIAHIMRHAMSSSFAVGVLTALLYVIVITLSINSLFPQTI